MSASEYTARAKLTRARWPPLKLTPRSPTWVISPLGSEARSSFNEQTSRTRWKASYLYSFPNRIFSRTVPENTQGVWQTYAIRPWWVICPKADGISPMIVWKREVLPQPTGPVIPIKRLLDIHKFRSPKLSHGRNCTLRKQRNGFPWLQTWFASGDFSRWHCSGLPSFTL